MVKILKYKKITTEHDIYIKVFTDGTVSYLTVSTDYFINTNNNETAFPKPRIFFKEQFEIKVQEGSVLKYLNFWLCQYPLSLSINQTDHIKELVNGCFPTGKFRNVDTPILKDSSYEK